VGKDAFRFEAAFGPQWQLVWREIAWIPSRSEQIPGILGQKAEQKQPKIWFCVHHLDFFFGNFPWDLSNKDVGYI